MLLSRNSTLDEAVVSHSQQLHITERFLHHLCTAGVALNYQRECPAASYELLILVAVPMLICFERRWLFSW